MVTRVFKITDLDSYAHWCSEEDGREAPMREMRFEDVTEDPVFDEVMCVVYGVDATKHYELGEYVLVTLDFYVGYNDDETRKQVIRVKGVSKISLPQNS